MMNKEQLIELIKKLQGNLTQNDFAEKCDISSSNLTRIYKGEQIPSPTLLKKIASTSGDQSLYSKLMIAAGHWEEDIGVLVPRRIIFGQRLRALMTESNCTPAQLSKISGVSESEINNYLSHEGIPHRPLELIQLAKALNVYSDYLSGESPYRNEKERDDAYHSVSRLASAAEQWNFDHASELIESLNKLFDEFLELSRYPSKIGLQNIALFVDVVKHFAGIIFKNSDDFSSNAKNVNTGDQLIDSANLVNLFYSQVYTDAEQFLAFRTRYIEYNTKLFADRYPEVYNELMSDHNE